MVGRAAGPWGPLRARPSPEGEVVRRLLLPDAARRWLDDPPPPASGEAIAGALREHRVRCSVHDAVDAVRGLPPQVEAAVRAGRRSMAVVLLRMLADLRWLSGVLEGTTADWVVLKGAATAQTLYGGLEQREWHDLDVLVGPRHFREAVGQLEASGARLVDRNWPMIMRREQGELSLLLPHGTPLDLHWSFVNDASVRRTFRVDTDAVLARKRHITIRGLVVPVLSREDQLVHLCLHACLSGGHRLQWLKDIQMATGDPDLDWTRTRDIATASRVDRAVAVLLDRAAAVLDARVPDRPMGSVFPLWRNAARWTTAARPPSDSHLGRRTGGLLYLSTRGSGPACAAALGRRAVSHLRSGAPTDVNPLHIDAGTSADREEFFTAVAGTARQRRAALPEHLA